MVLLQMVSAANREEIYQIISSLNINKSCGTDSIPTKILHYVQDQISNHLVTICNLPLTKEILCTILKIAKVIPIHKKDSKIEMFNY